MRTPVRILITVLTGFLLPLASVDAGVAAPSNHQNPPTFSAAKAPELSRLAVSLDSTGLAQTIDRQSGKAISTEPQDEVILLNRQPPCVRLLFDKEKLSADNDFHKKHLLVFPFQEYRSMQKSRERLEAFDKQIGWLQALTKGSEPRGLLQIPIFPQSDAAEVFHNQVKTLHFKNGKGVAFITSYANGDPPLTEDSQFYCFQGLTDDEKYYVSFFWPIKAPSIPKFAPIPRAVLALSRMPRNAFKPDLNRLDKMIESLSIK